MGIKYTEIKRIVEVMPHGLAKSDLEKLPDIIRITLLAMLTEHGISVDEKDIQILPSVEKMPDDPSQVQVTAIKYQVSLSNPERSILNTVDACFALAAIEGLTTLSPLT